MKYICFKIKFCEKIKSQAQRSSRNHLSISLFECQWVTVMVPVELHSTQIFFCSSTAVTFKWKKKILMQVPTRAPIFIYGNSSTTVAVPAWISRYLRSQRLLWHIAVPKNCRKSQSVEHRNVPCQNWWASKLPKSWKCGNFSAKGCFSDAHG